MDEDDMNEKILREKKIKECSYCGCYSPVVADVCCWCGSKEVNIIDGEECVKKEQEELAKTMARNEKKIKNMSFAGLIIVAIGFLLVFGSGYGVYMRMSNNNNRGYNSFSCSI